MNIAIEWSREEQDPATTLRVARDEVREVKLSIAHRDRLNRSDWYMVRHEGRVHRRGPDGAQAGYAEMRRWNLPIEEHLTLAGLGPGDRVVAVPFSDLSANLLRPSWARHAHPPLFHFSGEPLEEAPYHALACFGVDERRTLAIRSVTLTRDDRVLDADTGEDLGEQGLLWAGCSAPLVRHGECVSDQVIARHEYDLRHLLPPEVADSTLALWLDRPRFHAALDSAIRTVAARPAWYHSALGLAASGDLIVLQKFATLQQIAMDLKELGAVDALLLDSGGSCGVWTSFARTWISRGWYFRPARGAVLLVRLHGEQRVGAGAGRETEGRITVP
jgi:hypothetical protein